MNIVSQTAEYALRAMICISSADKKNPGQILTAPYIAEQTKVPSGYLLKVLQSLCRAGLVHSQRGIGGGFRLACDSTQTTIYDVVQAVDALPRIEECPLGNPQHTELCPLHRRLDGALESVEIAFKQTTIAELTETQAPLCAINC
jgi:Rrf2 family protein